MRYALLAVVVLTGGAEADTPKLTDHAKLLSPIQVGSLSLTPIVSTDSGADPGRDMIVLDEAMAAKQVRIKEVDDGEVNSLTLANTSNHPLFVLAGEVIIGGKQDRIIGRNTIIPAKKTLDVPVYCVEHGRWDGDSTEFTTAKALAHGRLRSNASYESQQAVWDEVADKNDKRKTKTSTDTYRKVAAQQTDGALAKLETVATTAIGKLSADDKNHLVGFAVGINGQVVTVDVFTSPVLFGKLQGKLVRSYLTDAIDVAPGKDGRVPTSDEVLAFLADADKAEAKKSYDTDVAKTTVNKGGKVNRAKVTYKPAEPKNGKTYDFTDDTIEGDLYLNYNVK